MGSSQEQGLSALISQLGNTVVKDSKSFGNELAKQIDGPSPVQENRIGKAEKTKKGEEEWNQSQHPENELPFVIPPMVPVLSLMQASAITLPPLGDLESAAGAAGDESVPPGIVVCSAEHSCRGHWRCSERCSRELRIEGGIGSGKTSRRSD